MSAAEGARRETETHWYLKVGEERHGPYSKAEIARYLGEGRLSPHSLMAREATDDWRIAREDPELSDLFKEGATPPPQTAPAKAVPPAAPEEEAPTQTDPFWAHIGYACYASILLLIPLPVVIGGAVIAYLNREGARGSWLESHYDWQIRTFWIGLVLFAIGQLSWFFFFGFIFWVATFLWVIYRTAKGWLALSKNRPIADPEAYF